MVRRGGNGRSIGGIVAQGTHAHVEVVKVRHEHEGIGFQQFEHEILVHVVQARDVGPKRGNLVIQLAAQASVEGVGRSDDGSTEFRAVLVAERHGNVRFGDVGAGENAVGDAQDLRETEGGRDVQVCRIGAGLGLELEIALDAQVELFAAVEDIAVVIGELGRNTHEAGRIDRSLQIGLEALQAGIAQKDAAIDLVVLGRLQVDGDAA